MNKNGYLYLTVFISGMTVLGIELSASRLLDPFFGNSLIIWANLIGMVLFYLSLGYWLGGKWADKDPRPTTFYQIIAWGGFLVGLIPLAAAPVLRMSIAGFAGYQAGVLIASLLGVVLLFSVPMTLLATASPFAIRLAVTDVADAGKIAGTLYAVSTLGSILGTFIPVLLLIPNIGTRATFLTFAVLAMVVAIGGLLQHSVKRGTMYVGLLVLLLALFALLNPATIKADTNTLFETESRYNYIQVQYDEEYGDTLLLLNEGQGIHSIYNPGYELAGGVWDYFLLAPYFNPAPFDPTQVESMLLIGSAAGTIPKLFSKVYGPIPIDGVEIDPAISQAGRDYFAMNEPNLTTYNQDGRYFLAQTDKTYDIIAVDAYRPPYIPFHLTTVEFVQEIDAHLSDDGVMAINVGHSARDYGLVLALANAMKQVFPNVFVIDAKDFGSDLGNSLVVASKQQSTLDDFFFNLISQPLHPMTQDVYERATGSRIWEATCNPTTPVIPGVGEIRSAAYAPCPSPFTDDKAPVEQVVHQLILDYMLGE